MAKWQTPMRPQVGQIIHYSGTAYRVTQVYAAGTCDVLTLDGMRTYRITGLGWR